MTQDIFTTGPSVAHQARGRGWRARLGSARVRRRFSRRQAAGMAELSVLVVVGSLITGLFVGDGLTRTAVDIADGVTWLTDDPSGQVIQVNPATGQPEVPLKVAPAGHDLEVGQYDDKLYVIDHTTGEMSAIDIGTLLRSGERRVSSGGAAETMTDGETVFLLDRGTGKISAIDPLIGDELGTVWLEEEGLADAAVDRTGTIWSLDTTGRLTSLRWSTSSLVFTTEDVQQVDGSGPGSVLVGHEEGVTIFGPDAGIVFQVGTGHDVAATSADLLGTVTAPRQSRSDLTAASAPASSTVVIVADDEVREVDVAGIGCAEPGRPEVFGERIYVPCLGEGKVIRLHADGTVAGPEIRTPGSMDPELVLDDDNLLINAPGSETGLVITDDGSVATIVRKNKDVAAITPLSSVADTPPASTPVPPTPPVENVGNQGNQGNPPKPRKDPIIVADPAQDPPTSDPDRDRDRDRGRGADRGDDSDKDRGTTPGPVPATPGPTGIGAAPGVPTAAPTSVPDPTSPTPTTPAPTTPTPTTPAPTTPTPTSPAPTTPTPPTPTTPVPTASTPTGVSASSVTATQVRVDWSYTGATPDDFVITRVGAGRVATVGGGQRQAVVNVTPGQASSFVVTANLGASSASSAESNTVTTAGAPGAPASVTSNGSFGASNWKIDRFHVDVTWSAAPDNGSPITGYRVVVTTSYAGGGPGPGGTYTVGPGARAQRHTETCYTGADPDAECASSGDYTVTVTAINAVGDGPATSDTGSQAPPPPTLPAGGVNHVVGESMNWMGPGYEGFGTLDLVLSPPADWRSFGGTCSYTVSGGGFNGAETGPIGCGATNLSLTVNHGIVRSQSGGQVTHNYAITFTASNGVGTVDSARHNGTYTGSSLCNTCPIP